MSYCPSPFSYRRRETREVIVGDPARGGVVIGGTHPVVVQSMLTCDTMDTAESVRQTLELVAAGRHQLQRLPDALGRVHRVAGEHGLNDHRMCSTDDHATSRRITHDHLASLTPAIGEGRRAIAHFRTRIRAVQALWERTSARWLFLCSASRANPAR